MDYGNMNELGNLGGAGGLAALLAIFGAIFFFVFLVGFAFWILKSYGLYRIATNSGVEYAWLSFIPIGELYVIGKLVKSVKIFDKQFDNLESVFPISMLVLGFLSVIPVIGTIISIVSIVFYYVVIYNLYKALDLNKANTRIILTIIFLGIPYPFILFGERNKSI